MNHKREYIVLLFGLSLLACKPGKAPELELPDPEIIPVTTHRLQTAKTTRIIQSSGLLTTEDKGRYAFKIAGVIDRIYVSEGAYFKKGELLATLQLDEIDAGFVQAALALEKAERDLQRLTNLFKDSVATLEQFQNTQTAYEISKKQVESAAFNRKYASIYAGSDGFVAQQLANEGEVVAGGTPILVIHEDTPDAWLLNVGLSDKDWAIVDVGNAAKIQFDAFSDTVLSGRVFRKSMAAEIGTGSFQVEIKVDSQGITPAIGMFGRASIITNAAFTYQAIPYEALVEADGKKGFVFVPQPNGKVKRQAVEVARFDTSDVKITSGLENIREVIRTNSAFLNENSRITIVH